MKFEKTYHIEENPTARDRKMNLKENLNKLENESDIDFIIISTGTNDISKLDLNKDKGELTDLACEQAKNLVHIVKEAAKKHDIDIFIVEKPPRTDDSMRSQLITASNGMLPSLIMPLEKVHLVNLPSLHNLPEGRKHTLFTDGIHLKQPNMKLYANDIVDGIKKVYTEILTNDDVRDDGNGMSPRNGFQSPQQGNRVYDNRGPRFNQNNRGNGFNQNRNYSNQGGNGNMFHQDGGSGKENRNKKFSNFTNDGNNRNQPGGRVDQRSHPSQTGGNNSRRDNNDNGRGNHNNGGRGDFTNGGRGDFNNGGRGDYNNGGRGDYNNGGRGDYNHGGRRDLNNGGRGDLNNGGRGDHNNGDRGDHNNSGGRRMQDQAPQFGHIGQQDGQIPDLVKQYLLNTLMTDGNRRY